MKNFIKNVVFAWILGMLICWVVWSFQKDKWIQEAMRQASQQVEIDEKGGEWY